MPAPLLSPALPQNNGQPHGGQPHGGQPQGGQPHGGQPQGGEPHSHRIQPRRGRPPIAGVREEILRAAALIFTRREYHEVLMESVAQECKVGKGTLYRYFPSKRELYLAVMFQGIEALRHDLQRAIDTPGAPAQKVERIVRCILTHFWDRRFFFALIHRNEHKAGDPDGREWLRRRADIAHLVERTLRDAIAAGELRGIDARIAAEMLLGMLRGVNRYRTRQDSLNELVAAVVDVFLCGVATGAGRRSAAKIERGDGGCGRS